MHFSEEDLKKALQRKDPGPGFTQRVMARIGQEQKADASEPTMRTRPRWWRWPLQSHPALAGALAALLLVIGSGLGYQQYQRVQQQKRIEAAKAELAREQMVQALKITNAKLTHVFRRVSEPASGEPKTRRQTL